MNTLLNTLLIGLASVGAIVSGYWLAAFLSAPAAPPPAFKVPMQFHQSPNADGTQIINEEAQEAVIKAISRFGRKITHADVHLDTADVPATFHDANTKPKIRYTVNLILDDGVNISTKLRYSAPARLPKSITETVRRCMKRHSQFIDLDRSLKSITNI